MSQTKLAALLSLMVAAALLAVSLVPPTTNAASHREAPLIALDPTADITDFFMFRSYEPGQEDSVVLIMDVIPGEEPSSGPNYWNFDPNVRYEFHIDNDKDGRANDIVFQVQFETEIRGAVADLDLFLSYLGNVPPDNGSLVPPITALDGPGSEGLGLRQTYNVTMVKDGYRTVLADGLFAVPSNVGPRTMPDYDALASQGIYDLGDGVKVFAGQRDDPFYIDLGAIFDTINVRAPGTDMLSGFNVHTIALQVPASMLTFDGYGPETTAQPVLGAYAATSRRRVSVLKRHPENDRTSGKWQQVQRLANPLVNETIIGTTSKDLWNRLDPKREVLFEPFYLNPTLALALELVFGVEAAKANRTDLRDLLLTYGPGSQRLSELLRLDVSVDPVPLNRQQRLTILAGDNAGWPNGRRPVDDVTDVAIQVVGGPNYIAIGAGDSVDSNDRPLPEHFPFLASPWDGRDRTHVNP